MQYRALFIGLTTIDIQYFVDEFPRSNTKIKTKPPELYVGGPATNAAVAFSKLNKGAFLATPTGNTAFSDFIKDDFNSTQISHFDLAKNQTFNPVIASVITTLKNGDRNIFTHNADLDRFDYTAIELFDTVNPELILIDGFFPEIAEPVAKIAKSRNVPVVMDCGSWKPQYNNLLKYTDFVICSSDFYPPGCSNSEHLFNYAKEREIKHTAISRGEKSILFQSKERGEVIVKNTKVADTLGAGDFLHGSFCYNLLKSNDFEDALNKAAELASFSCQYKGTRDWLKLY